MAGLALLDRATAQKAFLDEFAHTGIVGDGCKAAQVSRQTVLDWRSSNETFATLYLEAEAFAADAIEREVFRRGVAGYDEPLVWQGMLTGDSIRRYSDSLLALLIKAHRPDKFRERYDVRSTQQVLVIQADGRYQLPNLAAPDPTTIALGPGPSETDGV